MGSYSDKDRVVALSGVYQAAQIVQRIARRGMHDPLAFETTVSSLFVFDAADVAEVFGGPCGVSHGARALVRQMQQPGPGEMEVSRYVIAISHLANRVAGQSERMAGLHDALTSLATDLASFELGGSTRNARLADIYQTYISPVKPQIMVKGEPLYLQQADNTARIRAALLGGIRAAILWRQCGGRRRHLMLSGRSIARTARELLEHCADEDSN